MGSKGKQPISDALRRAIAASGMSFQALERETGVLRQSLMKFARGEQCLRGDAYDRLAVFFGLALRHDIQEGPTMYEQFWQSLFDDPELQQYLPTRQQPPNTYQCGFGSGRGEAHYGVVFERDGNVRVDVCLNCQQQTATKNLFDALGRERSQIEAEFGRSLQWDRRDHGRESRILSSRPGNINDDPEELEGIRRWVIETLLRLQRVFGPRLKKLIERQRQGYCL